MNILAAIPVVKELIGLAKDPGERAVNAHRKTTKASYVGLGGVLSMLFTMEQTLQVMVVEVVVLLVSIGCHVWGVKTK